MKKHKYVIAKTSSKKKKITDVELYKFDIEYHGITMEFSPPKEKINKFMDWIKSGGENFTQKEIENILSEKIEPTIKIIKDEKISRKKYT